jgi:hypothetical protein
MLGITWTTKVSKVAAAETPPFESETTTETVYVPAVVGVHEIEGVSPSVQPKSIDD